MCCHQHPENGSDLAMQNQEQITEQEYIEGLEAGNTQLLEALPFLNRYGHHDPTCVPNVYSEGVACPCGFNQAMDTARAAIQAAKK